MRGPRPLTDEEMLELVDMLAPVVMNHRNRQVRDTTRENARRT